MSGSSDSGKDASPCCSTIEDGDLYDLIVVGAGPHALALVARLFEEWPAALYTETEHSRLHWLRRYSGKPSAKAAMIRTNNQGTRKKGIRRPNSRSLQSLTHRQRPKVLVLDARGSTWLPTWDANFDALGIMHLRSPLFFHPHPGDLDALLAFAEREGRSSELMEIEGVVGKESSKHKRKKNSRPRTQQLTGSSDLINERDRKDYFQPSTSVFRDFCQKEIVDRYELGDCVKQGRLTNLEWLDATGDVGSGLFGVDICQTDSMGREVHKKITSRAAVVAVGAGPTPNLLQPIRNPTTSDGSRPGQVDGHARRSENILPVDATTNPVEEGKGAVGKSVSSDERSVDDLEDHPTAGHANSKSESTGSVNDGSLMRSGPGWCHSSALSSGLEFPPAKLKGSLERGGESCLVVVGGGLTSAQICDLALEKGFRKVKLICRSHLKVKPFDVDLPWLSKWSNIMKEDEPSARLSMIREARGGGSVNPPYHKKMKKMISEGSLEVITLSTITEAKFDPSSHEWSLTLRQESPTKAGLQPSASHRRLENVGYVVLATGFKMDIEHIPFLDDIRKRFPIESCGGLPKLTTDLQWNVELPLFVVGALASIQLGPGAGNLGGSREGAERVVNRLEDLWAGLDVDGMAGKEVEGVNEEGRTGSGARHDWELEEKALNDGNYFPQLASVEA